MLTRYRMYLSRQAGHGAARADHDRLADLLEAWPSVFETEPKWRASVDGHNVFVVDRNVCRGVAERSKVKWHLGGETREAIELDVVSDPGPVPGVHVHLTGGVEPLPLPGLYTPNRLSVLIRDDLLDGRATERLSTLLATGAQAFEADFGFIGTERTPVEPAPLHSEGVPPVAWLTYLSADFGPFPTAMPQGAVLYPQPKGGALVIAQPNLHRAHKSRHRDAVAAVHQALSGVLRPVAKPPRA